jgi:hypothetical protein
MRCVHVRRALLLFAIVIGLAAVAASLSRSGDEEPLRQEQQATTSTPQAEPETTPRAEPGQGTTEVADSTTTVELNAAEDKGGRIEAGRSATVEVAVVQPGQVTIPDLGLTAAADPLTPARFDVLVNSPGRYAIEFTPSEGDETRGAGTLVVTAQSG